MHRITAVVAAVLLAAAGLAGCSAEYTEPEQSRAATEQDRATKEPSPSATPTPSPSPTTVRRTVTEKRPVPFRVRTVRDSALDKGIREVRKPGVPGVRTLTYRVTLVDGERTGKRLVDKQVTKRPVTKVVAVGTKVEQPRCDSNYGGGCVPIASDVDCEGGSGDGPAYVQGPVRVVGSDIYDLDSDGDGFGCEAS